MKKTRRYKCRIKWTKGITLATEVSVTFDEGTKIKEVEAELKDYMAKQHSTDTKKFTADDVKITRIK